MFQKKLRPTVYVMISPIV